MNRKMNRKLLCSNDDLSEDDYSTDNFLYNLGKLLKKKFKSGYIHVIGKNLGWRHLNGETYARFDTEQSFEGAAEQIIRQIFPQTSSWSASVFVHPVLKAKGLEIRVTHHDNPVNGDCFLLSPCAESTWRAKRL